MTTDTPPRHPGVRFPPPALFVAGFVLAWLLETRVRRVPLAGDGAPPPPVVLVGWLLVALGFGVMLWAMATFARARTAILPHRPASRLVTAGPFGLSRNPMYVGMSLVYAGLALRLNWGWPLVVLPVVWVALYRFVIRREERYLGHAFGAEYAAYQRRVRRWL